MSISYLYQLQYACTCPLAQESLYNHTTQLACRVPSPCSHQGTRLKPQLHIPKHIDARCALVLEVQAEELATRHLAMSTPPHTSTHIWELGREKRDDKLLGSTQTHTKEGKRDGICMLVGKRTGREEHNDSIWESSRSHAQLCLATYTVGMYSPGNAFVV